MLIRSEEALDIRELYAKGASIASIARQFDVNWKTGAKWAKSTGHPRYKPRELKGSKLDPFKEYIRERMNEGCQNSVVILDEIQKMGYTGGKTILKDFMQPYRTRKEPKAVERFETQPGEQAQVDWGTVGEYCDKYGIKRKLYVFVMVLGYSRKLFAVFTNSMKMGIWLQCHLQAFEYFGGIPRKILYDNLKTAVDKFRDNGEPVLNNRFVDFANHYGFQIRLCKPYRPRTKGKVERPIRYLRENFLVRKDVVFKSLEEGNRLLSDWIENTANKRVHGTTHAIPDERFEIEKRELAPISLITPFDAAIYEERKVSRDCYVMYMTNRYSVPPKYAGETVVLRITPTEVHIVHEGQTIAQHGLLEGRYKTIIKHKHLEELKKLRQPKAETSKKQQSAIHKETPDVEIRSLSVYEEFATGGGR
jgi:transposase